MQQSGDMSRRHGRQPELDGVRGIAISLVLVGHALQSNFAGAFAAAGVTLFFGLSGFLITGLLVDEWERSGCLNLRRFYLRRMTRLALPLYAMLAVMVFVSSPNWRSVLAAATWTGNYTSLAGLTLVPFGHTWSLGVEEQFYLVWPLMLGSLLSRGRAVQILLGVTIVLVTWRGVLLEAGELKYAYDALETAGSAILVGALVRLSRWQLSSAWGLVATAGILGTAFQATAAQDETWMWVPWTVTPFVGLLLAAAPACRWLRWRPLVFAGVSSYSVYLWHEPVSHAVEGQLGPLGVAVGVAVGLVAYFALEAPLMRRRARTSVRLAAPATEAVVTRR